LGVLGYISMNRLRNRTSKGGRGREEGRGVVLGGRKKIGLREEE
jgi:hypothetical protein